MKTFLKHKFIRDAIHKNIDISEVVIQEIIATKEFQRLRWISQLSGAQIAYPCATQTRYTHSLGVYHILNRVLGSVQGSQQISIEDKLIIKIAGLLHDIGHGPLSHTFEKITNFDNDKSNANKHETYSCNIISDVDTELNKVLLKHKINIEQIISILKKDTSKCPKYQVQLISSQIDCDRIDYLMRDGYFTGVDYGGIDLDWLISNMIIDEKMGILFDAKAVSAIENYLITRFHMYSQVYYHKNSVFFDWNLQSLFQYLSDLQKQNYEFKVNIKPFLPVLAKQMILVPDYLKLVDGVIISFLNNIIELEQDAKLVNLAKNILYSGSMSSIKLKHFEAGTNHKDVIKVLKNKIYDLDEPILIKIDDNNLIELHKISHLLKDQTKEQTIAYAVSEN